MDATLSRGVDARGTTRGTRLYRGLGALLGRIGPGGTVRAERRMNGPVPSRGAFASRQIDLWLFTLLFVAFVYSHQRRFDAPTPVSRLDLLHALVQEKTVCIDRYHTNTPDKAAWDGHYYSDKAPGTVALALPAFALAAYGLRVAEVDLDSPVGWRVSSWVACAGSIAVVTALGGVALFAWLRRHVAPRWALVTVLALFLGAAPLPYATMMFSHALVVGLLAIALWGIEKQQEADLLNPGVWSSAGARGVAGEVGRQRPGGGDPSFSVGEGALAVRGRGAGVGSRVWAWVIRNRWVLLAGHACGWALASEYSSGLVVIGLFVWLVGANRGPGRHPSGALGVRARQVWERATPFCLSPIPPLLLIPGYSWACFGTPFALPYSYQASFSAMQEGVYGIKWPDLDTAFKLLFTPMRGLFFWTPFFVMAGFGYWHLIPKSRGLFWLTYLVPLLQIVVISGRTWDWPAGPTLGPRLLSPMLPLLALPCAMGVARWPRLGLALAVYSMAITTLATLTDACPEFHAHPNPLLDLHLPLLEKGEFSPNLGMVLGLSPYASVALYYALLVGGAVGLWRRLRETSEARAEQGSSE